MSYVLIYWLIANATLYSSTGSATFADAESCRAALTAIEKSWPSPFQASSGVCVPQSTAPAVTAAPSAPIPTTPSNGPSQAIQAGGGTKAVAPSRPNGG